MRRENNLQRNARTTSRIQEIVRVMVKYGFSEWVRMLRLDKAVPGIHGLLSRKGRPKVAKGATRWEIIRMAMEELGPTFIKLGQLMSNRTDVLPNELIRELARLQDEVAPIPHAQVVQSLRNELGSALGEVFAEFEETPTASASIAQVHRARLKDGTIVAVKVQRPGIEKMIETDLDIVAYLAKLAEHYIPSTRYLGPTGMVREFRRSIRRELDFNRERQNMERFASVMGHRRELQVPGTYERHSTKRLLVMEYIDGTKLSSYFNAPDAPHKVRFDPKTVAERGADLVLEQVLIHGFFHADPHPGNLMILPDNRICYLDFGMMGRLHQDERDQLASAIGGMVRRDGARVTDAVLQLTRSAKSVHYEELVDEVQELVDDYLDRALKDVNIGELFSDLITLIVSHGLTVPTSLLMVAKTLLTIEGVGMHLYPEFTLEPALEEATRKVVMNRLKPQNLASQGYMVGIEYLELLRDLPGDLSGIARLIRSGQLTVGFRVRGLEPVRQTLDSVGNRFVYGLVLAALMISSALIIHARVPPLWNNIPIMGVAGFGIAGVLALGFLFSLVVGLFRRR
ncbi:MAG: ABC1 kinase family protein [Spirochaetota bacterium]